MILNKEKYSQEGWLTTRQERRWYIIGEIGRVCEGSIVTSFMTLFLVFQGIELKLVAGVMLGVKIIDAFDDVVFGYFIDKLNITKWKTFKKITGEGKYLPWFRLTFTFFPLFTVFFFLMPADISMTGKLIWFTVFYILYDFGYTLVEVPMNSMMVTLTDKTDERNSIIQYKTIIGGLAIMLVQILWLVLVSEYVGIPLRIVAIISSVIFFFMMLPIVTKVKEHNTVLASADEEKRGHYSFEDMLNCVKTNKYLMILLLSTTLMTGLATGGAVGVFVSYYLFHSSLIIAIPIFIALIPQLIAQMQTAKLTKRFGKIRVILVTGLIGAFFYTGIILRGLILYSYQHFLLFKPSLVMSALWQKISLCRTRLSTPGIKPAKTVQVYVPRYLLLSPSCQPRFHRLWDFLSSDFLVGSILRLQTFKTLPRKQLPSLSRRWIVYG